MRRKHLILSAFALLLIAISSVTVRAGIINEKASDFTLPDLSGKNVSLADFKGKVVFLDFWASWCGPCKQEVPEISRVSQKYKNTEVVFLLVNIDKKTSHATDFLAKVPGLSKSLVIVLDPESVAAKLYNPVTMPTSYIVGKDGLIKNVHFGYKESDPATWVEEIDRLLK